MKVLMLSLTFLSFSTTAALACTCDEGYPSARQILRSSHSVFLGIPVQRSFKVNSQLKKTRFEVLANFKNAGNKQYLVYSEIPDDGANCGVSFSKDEGVFLVSTTKRNGRVITNACSVEFVKYKNRKLNSLLRSLARRNMVRQEL